MARRNVGGRVSITLDGQVYHPVADVEFEGARLEVESVVNQDGTGGRSVKPKLYKVKIKYRDLKGLSLDALMSNYFDFMMIEIDTGRTVILTDAFHEGTPNRNTVNGEIDGLMVVSESCQITERAA